MFSFERNDRENGCPNKSSRNCDYVKFAWRKYRPIIMGWLVIMQDSGFRWNEEVALLQNKIQAIKAINGNLQNG